MKKLCLITALGLFSLGAMAAVSNPPPKSMGLFIYNPIADSDVCTTAGKCAPNAVSYSQNYKLKGFKFPVFLYVDGLSLTSPDSKTVALSNSFFGTSNTTDAISKMASAYQAHWPNARVILMVDTTDLTVGNAIKRDPAGSATTLINDFNQAGWTNIDGIMFDVEGDSNLQTPEGQAFFEAVAKAVPTDKYLLITNQKAADPAGAWTFWHAMNRDTTQTCSAGAGKCQQGFWVFQGYDLSPLPSKNYLDNSITGYNLGITTYLFNKLLNVGKPLPGYMQIGLPASGSAETSSKYQYFADAKLKNSKWTPVLLGSTNYWGTHAHMTNTQCPDNSSALGCTLYEQQFKYKGIEQSFDQCQYACVGLSTINAMLGKAAGPAKSICMGVTPNYAAPNQTITPAPNTDKILGVALYQITAPNFSAYNCTNPIAPGETKCPTPIPYPETVDNSTWTMMTNWMADFWAGAPTTPKCQ